MEVQLTQQDKARLMLNLPTLANRFVSFRGKAYPIIHLGIGDLERFRAACDPIEKLYLGFVKSELPLITFMRIYEIEVTQMFAKAVPSAASVALGLSEGTVLASCSPLESFCAVLAQWLHNQEIGALQGLYPPPPDDEPENKLEGDPSASNPMGIVQKLASAYHWPFEEILKQTVPQVYLMGNDAAWSYAKVKADHPVKPVKTTKKAIAVDGKPQKNFDNMDGQQYRAYLARVFRTNLPGVDEPAVSAGGI